MENIVLAGIGILAYFFMRTLTGLKIFPLLHEILTALTGSAVKSTTQFREQTAVTFRRMSLDEKRKSMKYRYYCFINEVLAAFGLKQRGINVEGFTMSLIAIVIAISIVNFISGLCFAITNYLTANFYCINIFGITYEGTQTQN